MWSSAIMPARAGRRSLRLRRWGSRASSDHVLPGRSARGRQGRGGAGAGDRAEQSEWRRPVCLVMGGETTVTMRGGGSGGRNQELALAAALALDTGDAPAEVEIIVASLATDGTDGPTDAAGGVATPDSTARGRALGLDAHAALAANDSYPIWMLWVI